MEAEPEVDEAAAVVDQGTGVGDVGVEAFLAELFVAGEAVAAFGGAALDGEGGDGAK